MLAKEIHFSFKDTYRLIKQMENDIPWKQKPKESRGLIFISDKIGFISKAVKRDRDGHCIMIKGSVYQEDVTIINIYAPNVRAPKYKSKYSHL